MDSQNISAQIFTKQLPNDKRASYYGCKDDMDTDFLTTCVNNEDTDRNIENAFQQQMDLSDYYKSKNIFNSMKKQFADQTMEGAFSIYEKDTQVVEPKQQSATPILPVGPRDNLFSSIGSKEFFGSDSKSIPVIPTLAVLFLLFLIVLILIKKK
jgi:hypothetical protein